MITKSKSCVLVFSLILGIVLLVISSASAQTSISCGQTLSGSISSPGEKDQYTLTAAPGDKATIRLIRTAGTMVPDFELYDSQGTRVGYSDNWTSSNTATLDIPLTLGGTYTLIAYARGNANTGNYNLTWQRLNAPCNAAATTCGLTTPASISAAGEQDHYTLTAAPGDKATIRLIRTAGTMAPDFELYDSQGTRVGYSDNWTSSNTATLDTPLTLGGTYTLIVSARGNANTGSYNLTWQRLNAPCNAAATTCGLTTPASISAAGEQDHYTLTAAPGDKATIRLIRTAGTMAPDFELYDSQGTRVGYSDNWTSSNTATLDTPLTLGGTYTLIVSARGNANTGSYNLTWQRLNAPCNAAATTCGLTTPASISAAGEQDHYTLTAAPGDKATIRLIRTAGTMAPDFELYDSQGTRVGYSDNWTSSNTATLDTPLTLGGTYTLIAYARGNANTGNYNLTWQRLNAPCNAAATTCGLTTPASISAAGEQDHYTLTAAPGDKATIRLIRTAGTMAPDFELYDSQGTRVGYSDNWTSSNTATLDTPLTLGGTYTLIVSARGNANTGSYNLTWQRLNAPCNAAATTCGLTTPASISAAGEQDHYTLTAAVNDNVTISMVRTSGTMAPDFELYDSLGTRVGYSDNWTSSSTATLDIPLTLGGTYTLIASARGNANTGSYNLTWQFLNRPCATTTLQFSSATYSVSETGGSATITVTRSGGSSGAVGVNYATSNGTASAGSDYTATSGTLSWANGDTANKTFSVPILTDSLTEGNETVNLTLSNPTGGATLGSPSTAVLTILDVPPQAGTLQFSVASYSVNETGGSATITVTRANGSGGAVGVSYATSNGTASAGSDYTATSGTLSWANGDTANKTFSVPILTDSLTEGNETVNLTLSNPTGGATLGSPSTAVLTILDVPPQAGTLQFSVASYSVNETGGSATITVTRANGSGGAVGVSYATSNGTATAGSDYTATSGTLSWANGDTANKTFSVPILTDSLTEGNETVNLTLSNPTGGATLGSPSTAVLTILDVPPQAGTLQFSVASYSVNETGGSATITVTRANGSGGAVGVSYATSNGTASAGSDYTATSGTLSWANGDTANKTFSVPILTDSSTEGNETVNLTLSNPTGGATLGSPSTAVLTIIDVPVPGTLQFSSATYIVNENGGGATITVTRSGGNSGAVGVTYATSNGTATAGLDYTAVSGTLNWANGDTAGKTFNVPILTDSLTEGDETVNLTLSNPTGGATLGSPGTAVLTIQPASSEVTIPFTVLLNGNPFADLEWGWKANATDIFDNGIDGLAPPPTVDGDDAYFQSITGQAAPSDKLRKDFRAVTIDPKTWKLVLKVADGKVMKLQWNPQTLPAGSTFSLQEANMQVGWATGCR